jgi:tetrapyrrole methylase family protein/MazG family protein
MNEIKIKEFIFCGVFADPEMVKQAADAASVIIARGNYAAEWLRCIEVENGITWEFCPGEEEKAIVYVRDQLNALLPEGNDIRVLYVTPVQPFAIDMVGKQLAEQSEYVVEIPGADPLTALSTLEVSVANGAIQSLDGLKILGDMFPVFSTSMSVHLNMAGINLRETNLLASLRQVYPETHTIYVFETSKWRQLSLGDFNNVSAEVTSLYIPALSEDSTLEYFMLVIARLRAPDGCPWDRKQTHTSLRPYLLEEVYEALDSLDKGNVDGLREELGDILLQIALHAQIAVENGEFNIAEVIQGISRKIVSRHPHVFGAVEVRDDRDVVQNWEKLKEIERAEKKQEQHNGLLDGIPSILPALSQAQSIQDRAARVGFDWPEIAPVIEKVNEEMQEVDQAQSPAEREHELGDLLFAVVNLVRWYKVDAESALRYTNMKFRKRFAYLESEAKKSGRELQKMTLEEMDALWEDAKSFDD